MTPISVYRKHQAYLLGLPGVISVYPTGTGIQVLVSSRDACRNIPARIEGVRILVRLAQEPQVLPVPADAQTEASRLLDTAWQHQSVCRPLQGGVSVGPLDGCTGTMTCVMYRNGDPVILSNNHVLAQEGLRPIGYPIVQPATSDGGDEIVGVLADVEPLWTEMANKYDAAIALINGVQYTTDIYGIGPVNGVGEAVAGQLALNSSRTAGISSGTVESENASVKVYYPDIDHLLMFVDQIVIEDIDIRPGNSGSPVLDESNMLLGSISAGIPDMGIAYVNKMPAIMNRFGLSLDPRPASSPLPRILACTILGMTCGALLIGEG